MKCDAELDDRAMRRLQGVFRKNGLITSADVLTAELINGGRSNLTYRVTSQTGQWVLRRPPLGHVLHTAHDMGREYRVLTGLAASESSVPVPVPNLMCARADIIGAPFYVMEFVEGDTVRTAQEALVIPPLGQARVGRQLAELLGRLHQIDPSSVGLDDFGRPAGFIQRQVARWARQLADSRSRDLPGIEMFETELANSVPRQRYSAIVHGDYRMDNCLIRNGEIVAVLDWEMATLGDPMSDVGLFAVYYSGLSDIDNPIVQALDGIGSYPPIHELLDLYSQVSGHDLTDIGWYTAFAWFKFAAILEGIHYRTTLGATVGAGFDGVAELVEPSIERGRSALAGYQHSWLGP